MLNKFHKHKQTNKQAKNVDKRALRIVCKDFFFHLKNLFKDKKASIVLILRQYFPQ